MRRFDRDDRSYARDIWRSARVRTIYAPYFNNYYRESYRDRYGDGRRNRYLSVFQNNYYRYPRYSYPSVNYGSFNDGYYGGSYRTVYVNPQADNYYGASYYDPYAGNYYTGFENDFLGGSNWTEQLLGIVLPALLGGVVGGDDYYAQPQYSQDYAYQNGYYDGGAPAYNGYGMGADYPALTGYSNLDGILGPGLFGIADHPYSDGYADDIVQRAFSSGYEQGYLAGLAARENGYENTGYDPYLYEDSGYGYGAYSSTMNEHRRCLSDGYNLGYEEAFESVDQNYQPQFGGDVDLVSVLLSSALGVFNSRV